MSKYKSISIDLLRQLLDYDPATGSMTWKPRKVELFASISAWKTWNTRYSGQPAFTALSNGYRQGALFGVMYRAARVAYAIYNGEWPDKEVDHINGNTRDNSAGNLRCVSHGENMRNIGSPKDNASGAMGVIFDKARGKWMAFIRLNKKQKNLGRFDNFESAKQARKAGEVKYGFHENHGRKSA
jgi:hypothetical protein